MSRRVIAGVAALVIALVGALGVIAYARGADQRALAGQEAVRAYVADKEVPAGTTAGKAVKDNLISQKLIARKAVPDDVLTDISGGYEQLVATSTIRPGELIIKTRFAAKGATEGLLAVPAGKFAVSVALDDPSHVGPFVTVGSKVAIFDTFNVQETDKKDTTAAGDKLQDRHEYQRATRLLLPSVEVLGVGATTSSPDVKETQKPSDPGQPQTTDRQTLILFTLAVTQAEAEKLVHAARTGTVTFALIGSDATAAPGKGIDDRRLFEVTK